MNSDPDFFDTHTQESESEKALPSGIINHRNMLGGIEWLLSAVWLRIFVGFLLLIFAMILVFANILQDAGTKNETSLFLQRLNDRANTIAETELREFAHVTIKNTEDLPRSGALVASLDGRAEIYEGYVIPAGEEVRDVIGTILRETTCSQLDCNEQFWPAKANLPTDPVSHVTAAVETSVFTQPEGKICGKTEFVPLFANIDASNDRRVDESNPMELDAWLEASEVCRKHLTRLLREESENSVKIQTEIAKDRQIVRDIMSDSEAHDRILRASPVADRINGQLEFLNKDRYHRNSLCFASKLLAIGYFRRSGSRILAPNQERSSAIIAAAVSLATCKLTPQSGTENYIWLIDDRIDSDPVPRDTFERSVKEADKKGFEALPTKCNKNDQNTSCVVDEENMPGCRNLVLTRNKKTRALAFAQIDPFEIIAEAEVGSIARVDAGGTELKLDEVTALLCSSGGRHLDGKGLVSVVLELGGNGSQVYISQTSESSKWNASGQPFGN